MALLPSLSIVIASSAILAVASDPVVILLASRAGISFATKSAPEVTIPLALTVTFSYVPADTPEFAIERTPFTSNVKGAEPVGTFIAPITLVVAIGKSPPTKSTLEVN